MRETSELQWRAVTGRDPSADGAFVYAVRSTGVYCRPTCPSRRPRRENVRFFARAEEAERAGYRACRRCQPGEAAAPAKALVARVRRFLDGNAGGKPTLAALGEKFGVSPHHLQRTFTRLEGVSPGQYAGALRLETFKARVKAGEPVTAALYDSGFGSSSRLYEQAPAHLGMTPAIYRKGAPGVRIAYATGACALGRVLVASTPRGLCSVRFGDSDAALEKELRQEYPLAAWERQDGAMLAALTAVRRCLDIGRSLEGFPLDVAATAFQQRVWTALRKIPAGESRSYGEVAAGMGRPTAARAVARACAANPVALAVPCHRVVQKNGAPGGYRWGAGRKRQLLEKEAACAALERTR